MPKNLEELGCKFGVIVWKCLAKENLKCLRLNGIRQEQRPCT